MLHVFSVYSGTPNTGSLVLLFIFEMEKNKPLQTRVYDSDGYRLRAEVICFRDASRKEVCITYVTVCSI